MEHTYYHIAIGTAQQVAERQLAKLDNNIGLVNAKQDWATGLRKTAKGKFIKQHK